eukprot:602190-Prorocentrum_minimum.AAC.1
MLRRPAAKTSACVTCAPESAANQSGPPLDPLQTPSRPPPDPLQTPSRPPTPKTCDDAGGHGGRRLGGGEYEEWHTWDMWSGRGCRYCRYDRVAALKCLQGKRLVMVGDSVSPGGGPKGVQR